MYMQAIDKRELSAFGVRTLCHLELNDPGLEAPADVGWAKRMSLLVKVRKTLLSRPSYDTSFLMI